MCRARRISGAVRAAAFWLLALSLLVGAEGIGTLAAFAADSCESWCSCHEAEDAEHGHGSKTLHGNTTASHHSDDHPADDNCPADCPDCSCCPGVVLGVLRMNLSGVPLRSRLDSTLTPVQSPASTAVSGIFRPPRSLV